jgi:Na+/H+ antiporter NhaD/arsenite permease-like protein
MVLLGVLSPGAALLSISFPVIAFLFSMFVFVAALDNAGVLSHLAAWLISRGRGTARLPFYLFVGFGLLSALLMNDALVLLGVPLVLALARRMGVSPVPLLLTIAYAVTVGSVMTPLGNPQNALIALSSGLSYPVVTFAEYLVLPTVVNLLLCGWLLSRWFGPSLANATPPLTSVPFFPRWSGSLWLRWVRNYPSVLVFPATLGVLIVGDAGAALGALPLEPIWAVTLAGALILLVLQPTGRDLANRVDWSTLLLFVGLFVVMGGVWEAGLFGTLGGGFHIPAASAGNTPVATLGLVVGSSLLGSQVLSNVPWTALFIPLLKGLGYGAATPRVWMALAAGTTLAGNLTLLGAASNLIVVTQAEKARVRVGFWEFMRYGIPLTLLSTGVVFVFLLAGL